MDDKFRKYAGIGVPSPFKLGDSGNLIRVQPPVIEAQQLDEQIEKELEMAKEVVKVRPVAKKVIENEPHVIVEKMLEFVERGYYSKAYSLHCNSGVSIANHPQFLELLYEIASDALHADYAGAEHFRLLYLLGKGFDIDLIPNLRDFIKLVFDTYCYDRLSEDGSKPIDRLNELFGDQISLTV